MSSSKTKIFFRADGNSEVGLGHVVRSLALVEMLKMDFECKFLIRTPDKDVVKLIQNYCPLIPLDSNTTYSDESSLLNTYIENRDIMVIDGYHFDSDYQKKLKSYVYKLVTIDDEASFDIYADLLINHGNSAVAGNYKLKQNTKLLLGPDYLMVRHNFRKIAKQQRNLTKIDSVFICMGGADPYNITPKVVKSALGCSFLKKIIVVTGSAFHFDEEMSKLTSNNNIQWEQNISSEKMIELIESCDIAITTASSISLEVCCVKVGLLIGIVASNQQNIHDYLISEGCALTINDFRKASEDEIKDKLFQLRNLELINQLVQKQTKLFDGLSGERIRSEFKMLTNE